MRIARVFPVKTSYTPTDKDVYVGEPDMFVPKGYYDEIHISVTFTWDIGKSKHIGELWSDYGKVRLGGPAYGDPGGDFTPGMYLKNGVTITSRGCNNKCGFCFVPKREGMLREINIEPGHIVQDNNILACSRKHLDAVAEMLRGQRNIEFKGGLEAKLVDTDSADWLRSFRVKTLWLACDHPNAISGLYDACKILQDVGFTRNKMFCYVLIGKDRYEEENRLKEVWNAGCIPFAQLYRNEADDIKYSKEWKQFQRQWSRPAIIKSVMSGVAW